MMKVSKREAKQQFLKGLGFVNAANGRSYAQVAGSTTFAKDSIDKDFFPVVHTVLDTDT